MSRRRPHFLRRELRTLADALPRMRPFARHMCIESTGLLIQHVRSLSSTSWTDKGRISPPVTVPRSLRRYFGRELR
jgi:hypothetical protein